MTVTATPTTTVAAPPRCKETISCFLLAGNAYLPGTWYQVPGGIAPH